MSSIPVPMSRLRPLAHLLRASRLKAGLTQQQVAESIAIHPGVYGSIERAGMMPAVPTLQKICLVLKLDYQSLVDRVTRGEEAPED